MEDICIVCAEPLQFTAYAGCGHKDACSKCVSRLRSVLKDQRCVYCQVRGWAPPPAGARLGLHLRRGRRLDSKRRGWGALASPPLPPMPLPACRMSAPSLCGRRCPPMPSTSPASWETTQKRWPLMSLTRCRCAALPLLLPLLLAGRSAVRVPSTGRARQAPACRCRCGMLVPRRGRRRRVAAASRRAPPCSIRPASTTLQGRAKRGELKYMDSAQAYFDDAAHFAEISRMCSYTHPRVWQDSPGERR